MSRKKRTADDLLLQKGLTMHQLENLLRKKEPIVKILKPRQSKIYKFGIVSDTHLVDRHCDMKSLYDFYRRCRTEGITEIVHAGDIAHGMGIYRGQENDLLCFGVDDHVAFCVKNYPKVDGITTYFIGGNHDEGYKIKAGVDFGHQLQSQRPDLVYLGFYDATVILNGVKIGLHHGAKGVPYSISYHMQKYIEKLPSGSDKPQIYILGHYHAAFYMFYRNVHCFLPGAWERPNDFSVRMGFPNIIGGWIVELEVAPDRHNSIYAIKSQFVSYY